MSDPPIHPSVVVIGGGVAGLAAARRLQRSGVVVTVLERLGRVGGRVFTEDVDGFMVDGGAQFITSFSTRTLGLIREVGLQDRLVPFAVRGAVLRAGRLVPVGPGLGLGSGRLLSVRARMRALKLVGEALVHRRELDPHAPEKAFRLDTRSAAAYADRALGPEVREYLVDPMLGSFTYWTAEHTSQAMLFLLVRAGLGTRELSALSPGLGILARSMAQGLDVRTEAEALAVATDGSGPLSRWAVTARVGGREARLVADGVLCATTAGTVPRLFPGLAPPQRSFFDASSSTPNVVVAVGVRRRLPGRFFGILFPPREARSLATAAIMSARDPSAVPPGRDLIMLYPSGPAGKALMEGDDAEVRAALLADLRRAGPAYDPGSDELFSRVYRWSEAIPVFDVGYLRRLRAFLSGGSGLDRVAFAGDYLGGPFVEGAVRSGELAADRLRAAIVDRTARRR